MSKENPESNHQDDSNELSDIDAEWQALNRVSKESREAAQDIDAESHSEALIAEAIRGELKAMFLPFSDRLLMMPDSYPEKRLLMNVAMALGMLLSPQELHKDRSRMYLSIEPLQKALDEVLERYRRLSGLS
jgi:hypothetical protein